MKGRTHKKIQVPLVVTVKTKEEKTVNDTSVCIKYFFVTFDGDNGDYKGFLSLHGKI